MIYNIAEWVATIFESTIIFAFLINVLAFKEQTAVKKYSITFASYVVYNVLVFMLNWFYTIEGILTILYIFVLILFCRLALRRKIWFQCITVILVYVCIYIINISVTLVISHILNLSMNDVLLMRNPLRIFLLFFTKLLLCIFLYILETLISKRKLIFSTAQCTVIFIILLISFGICVTLEKIQLENRITGLESSIITVCLILINCLLLIVAYLISSQNNEKMQNELLKFQIKNEKRSMEESLVWNRKVETIQHDIKNHLGCILDLVKSENSERVIQYIENLCEKTIDKIPNRICTNHSALNAVLNLKMNKCCEQGIDLKCCIPDELPEVDDVDLCIVLANLFDNAIEAEGKEACPIIKLNISIIGNYLNIKMKNYISYSVLEKNKSLQTSKKDKEHHGFGILSIIETVQKNDGMQEFFEEGNWFIANILLKINHNYR